jgi:hypothetical protein
MKKQIIFAMALSLLFSGCIKKPDKLLSPSARIDITIEENKEIYNLTVTAGILNENHSKAVIDYSANMILKDSASSVLLQFPVKAKSILPFETFYIDAVKKMNEQEAMKIVDALSLNREDLIKSKTASTLFIDEKNIELTEISYKTSDIVDLLKGKKNEKN